MKSFSCKADFLSVTLSSEQSNKGLDVIFKNVFDVILLSITYCPRLLRQIVQ